MQSILEIKNFTKTYAKDKKAVDNLSLSVMPGEIHGFIGHNGAGKTTTIRAVVGVMDFEQGEIFIEGHSVKKEPITCKSLTIPIYMIILRGFNIWAMWRICFRWTKRVVRSA